MSRILFLLQAGRHPELTSFFSIHYLIFFLPLALLLYGIAPKKWKRYVLLAVSLGFFWFISGIGILYLLASMISIWGFGLWMDHLYSRRDAAVKAAEKPERKAIKKAYRTRCRWILALAVCLHIGLLLVIKYSGFFMENVNALFGAAFPVPKYVMPIGISFFTLQAVSYLMDVYRQTIPADRNFFRLALFLSFFPQIVEGPICRYGQTTEQLWNGEGIRYENLTLGLQRILYGLMKKLVVADRLNAFVKVVFGDVYGFQGGIVAMAAVCYTIQLYMDFSGSMDAVCGTAQILGITMPENFRRPFFSRTVSEFWTRWHISLGAWFKDYIFYPVTMSGPMKNLTSAARKKLGNHFGPLIAGSIALFCVWFCNGLWHGAAWSFVFFGMYHFAIILTGSVIAPWVKSAQARLHINPDHWLYRGLQILRTCVLVVIGELFFRAESLREGMILFKRMVTDFTFPVFDKALWKTLGIDRADLTIVGVTVVIVFVVSLLQERGIPVRETLKKQNTAVRWAVLYALILYIVIFGAYGHGYVPVNPMYANF